MGLSFRSGNSLSVEQAQTLVGREVSVTNAGNAGDCARGTLLAVTALPDGRTALIVDPAPMFKNATRELRAIAVEAVGRWAVWS